MTEYKVMWVHERSFLIDETSTFEDATKLMNDMAAEGWKVFSVSPHGQLHNIMYITFQRD